MNPGMIVCSGRLRGASAFGWLSSSVNSAPRLCSAKPVPGGTMPLPNAVVDALDQRDDVAVAIDRRQVDRVAARRGRQAVEHGRLDVAGGARRRRSAGALRCACALSSIAATGAPRIAGRRRSAACRRRRASSPRSSRAARARCGSRNRASGKCSIRFSIISAAMPCVFGGSSYTVHPR